MEYRDKQLLVKLLAEIGVISALLDGYNEERFVQDERTVRAVCMTLINIGELVKNLTDGLKAAYPHVPWRAISGMRDVTAHRYQTLNVHDVYLTCVSDIPELEKSLRQIYTPE